MQKTWRSHLLLAYSLAILAFLYVPLVILAMYSFNDSRINAVWTGFTFRWYEQLFNNRRVLEALINTLIIGFASTIVSTTLGTIAAIALHRYKYKMQSVINGLVYLPILIPEIVMGLSLLVLFSQVQMPLGKGSLILAHITFCLSFVVITVGARLDGMRSDYEQAASDLYATPWQCFRYITLPLTMPGVAAGTILVFISSLGMFVVPDVMGGAKSALVGNLIQHQFLSARDWPFGSALSIVLAVLSLLLIILYYRAIQAQNGGAENAKNMA